MKISQPKNLAALFLEDLKAVSSVMEASPHPTGPREKTHGPPCHQLPLVHSDKRGHKYTEKVHKYHVGHYESSKLLHTPFSPHVNHDIKWASFWFSSISHGLSKERTVKLANCREE